MPTTPPTRVLGRLLEQRADQYGARTFLTFKGKAISFEQMNQEANRYANGFLNLGVRKGDTVCNLLPNCPEYIYTWFGLAKIGAIEIPVNTNLRGDLLSYVINHSDARILVVDRRFLDNLEFIKDELQSVRTLVIYSPEEDAALELPSSSWSVQPFGVLLDAPSHRPDVDLRPGDTATIVYTSGTTGRSKGVMLSHNFCWFTGEVKIQLLRVTPDDVMYTCLPLFHTNARFTTLMTGLVAGARVALSERFSASRFWSEIKESGTTIFSQTGPIAPILYQQPPRDDDVDNRVRVVTGKALPPPMDEGFQKRYGLRLLHGFAMTESGLIACDPIDEPTKTGSFGKAAPGYELKIFDDEDNELPPNTVGEFVIRPLLPYAMLNGYFKMPEETLRAFRNFWFHTGDYAYVDEQGYFFFVDRKKDAIRRRGEMVSSFEVEKVINSHPSVRESAAVGVPAELGEEEIKVLVALKEGEPLLPEDLLAHCEQRMAYFMVPRYVEFRQEFARTATGKIQKEVLRKEGIASAWDREKAGYKLKK